MRHGNTVLAAGPELVLTAPDDAHARQVHDERLDHLFEARCDWVTSYGPRGRCAVDSPEGGVTYAELDARANRLARHLRERECGPGDRIGLLLDGAVDAAVAALATLKAGAACVPLDGNAPAERALALVGATRVRTVLSSSAAAERMPQVGDVAELVHLDRIARSVDAQDAHRLVAPGPAPRADRTAYVVDVGGPDDEPVTATIDHTGLCAVVRGAAEVYGLRPADRVSIVAGLAVEGLWVPWAGGAAVVPAPAAGRELWWFLRQRRVTVLRCTAEVLAGLSALPDGELPDLRLVVVSGGPCPPELVERWYRPGRRILDVHGAAGASSVTWAERYPGAVPTSRVPLPAFSAVVLDRDDPGHVLPPGQLGEIGIAGVGLGCGYLGPADRTLPDRVGVPANPSGRIHRTGDLGRVTAHGEIEHHGRVRPRPGRTSRPYADPRTEPALRPVPALPRPEPADPTGLERDLAAVLADVLGVAQVPVDGHLFEDLGADSMVMARFCARVRKRPDLPSPSMKDVYRHPTVRSLAAALAPPSITPAPVASVALIAPAAQPVSVLTPVVSPTTASATGRRAGTVAYVLCGVLQLLVFVASSAVAGLITVACYEYVAAGSGAVDIYLRAVLAGAATYLGLCLLPILAKWVLVGRWQPREIRLWSPAYLRFWVVKTLVRANPLVLFAGSPLYVVYLRALGARIGRNVVIFSRTVPVCTDLLTIGDDTVIRKDSSFTCYQAHDGVLRTGPVTLGKCVLVGEMTVIDIETSLGDGAQLGHSSSLHAGQAVPAGERWHGTPARLTDVDYLRVGRTHCGALRKTVYTLVQLLIVLGVLLPLALGGVVLLLFELPQLVVLLDPATLVVTNGAFYRDALVISLALFAGTVLLGLLLATGVARLLNLALEPDKVYGLYGVHFWIHEMVTQLTNIPFFTYLFGDSSFVVHYLSRLGYDLSQVHQTGSNFGLDVKHDNPFLTTVGSGTMAADGLSIVNTDYSSTSFRVSRTSIGGNSFLGNYIAYPAGGRIGDNCLIATKAMVPLDGDVREGVGLLGSPSFEIPRSVARDGRFDHFGHGAALRRRLAHKNRHNATTMALFLLVRWVDLLGFTLLALATVDVYLSLGTTIVVAAAVSLVVPLRLVYFALVERAATGFRALRPRYCSIYDPYFWWHERYWKLSIQTRLFTGTPFRGLVWRLLGVRVGRRLFDDGAVIMEKTMVRLGDDTTLNAGSIIQCHSQEDGVFKSDGITIGSRATIGVSALVHYGVTIGDGAVLTADSFLMKGEEVPAGALWSGNPAVDIDGGVDAAPVAEVTEIRRSRAIRRIRQNRGTDDDRPAVLAVAAGGRAR